MVKVRNERVAAQFQRELSDILRTHVKDPRIGFVTVTGVELSADMAHAKVFVSVFGDQEERAQTLLTLRGATGFVRAEVARRIRLRIMPELHFKLDESLNYGAHIGEVLRKIAADEQAPPDEGGDGDRTDTV